MRVLYVSRGYTPHDRRFLTVLSAAGHVAGFLPLEDSTVDARDLPKGVLLRSGSIPDALRSFKPDVTQAGPVPSCAYRAALADARPLVAVSWGADLLTLADEDKVAARHALDHCDLFLCDSLEVAEVARWLSGISAERMVRFPWGVDLTRFSPAPVRSAVTNLVCTRAWEPGYGIETVVTAFAAARLVEPQLCLTLLGGGSLEPKIRRFVQRNRLGQAVMMRGRVGENDLPLYLAAADLYISGSPVDGSSISLLEALATALPAIVADRPSNREWITPGVNGWVAPPGDARAFSRAILKAVALPLADRERMRAANIAIARSRADWSKHSSTYVQALESLCCLVPA